MNLIKQKKVNVILGLLIAVKSFAATPISGQSANPSINPANVTWNLEDQIYSSPSQQLNFQVLPAASKAPSKAAASSEPTFILKGVKFTGNETAIPQKVRAVYQSHLNKPTNLDGLSALAQEMQTTYRSLGLILVRVVIPPQEIDKKQAVVTFQVIAGQIQKVIFTGDNPGAAKAQLQRYALAMANENPISYQTIDHFLNLANKLPGISVSANLEPDKNVVGGADLVIKVKRISQSGFLSFNNYGTSYIGPGQGIAGASLYDIFAADNLSVSGATSTSKFNELRYLSGSYDLITGPYSTEINPMFSTTETRPGGALTPAEMVGYSNKYTLNVNQPLIVSSAQNLTFNSSLYHLSSNNNIFQNIELYNDIITAITAGLTYQGNFLENQNKIDAYTTVGLPILGAPKNLSDPSRLNGRTEFMMLDFNTSSTRYLTQRLSVNLSSTGQITPDPLLVSEQIGYGGMSFGQGFTPYIISGDNGVFANLALRYDLPALNSVNLLQPEVFYSAGKVTNNQALEGTVSGASAASAGAGLNMVLFHSCQIGVVLAKPLRLTQVNNSGSNGWQAFINLVSIF